MFSSAFPAVCIRFWNVSFGRIVTVMAIGSAIAVGCLVSASDARPSPNTAAKVGYSQPSSARQSSSVLGSPLSTDLATYRESCRNPRTVAQISSLCVSLGAAATGGSTDGSAELGQFTNEPSLSTSGADLFSSEPILFDTIFDSSGLIAVPNSVQLGLIQQEQNDRVQVFFTP